MSVGACRHCFIWDTDGIIIGILLFIFRFVVFMNTGRLMSETLFEAGVVFGRGRIMRWRIDNCWYRSRCGRSCWIRRGAAGRLEWQIRGQRRVAPRDKFPGETWSCEYYLWLVVSENRVGARGQTFAYVTTNMRANKP